MTRLEENPMTSRRIVTGIVAAITVFSLSEGEALADLVDLDGRDHARSEFRANTFTVSSQAEASLAVGPEGQFVVVWSSRRQQGGRYGVYAQRFDADGVAIGAETLVNLWTQSHQRSPAVAFGRSPASNATGDRGAATAPVWAVWQSHGQDGHAGSIILRNLDDSAGGSERLVNQTWTGHQHSPVLATDHDGRVLVAWTSHSAEDRRSRVRLRLFGPHGEPLTDEIGVCEEIAVDEQTPAVAFDGRGRFAVVYAVFDEVTSAPLGVRMQRFDADGNPLAAPNPVSDAPRFSEIEPVIAASGDGYVIAWLDAESDGSDYGIIARRFDDRGNPIDDPLLVNALMRAGVQNAPAIAVAGDGRFVIAFNADDGDQRGVFAQWFDHSGNRIGDAFRINRHTAGDQAMREATGTPRLAIAPNGALLCAWSGDAGLGDASSANVTMLSPEPIELAGKVQGVTEDTRPALAREIDDGIGGAMPHEPPTFDPRTIDDAAREITRGEDSIGFTGIVDTGWTPPDPHLAVGPNHIVIMTNGGIAFFTKDGTETFFDEIEDSFGFWGEVGATHFVFDPEVIYDPMSGRFFAMAAEAFAPGSRSYVLVAVSDDSDPNGTWHKYRFETTVLAGNLFDSPNISVDDQAVYITGDGIGIVRNYPVFIFDKPSLLAGNPPAIEQVTELITSTQSAGIPPISFDDPPALYMIEHREGGVNTSVRLIALTDPLGTPEFTTFSLDVPSYQHPPEWPPQSGTSSRPNTFDVRFWSAAYRNGSLWATHHIGSSRVLARWYEIAMNGWPDSGQNPELVQSGTIDPGPGVRTFFSSITADEAGNAAICYARSSPSEFISMATAQRLAGDPPGTMRPGIIWRSATGPYIDERWGDYSAVNLDPASPRTFWAHHEWAEGQSWRTWVQSFELDCAAADLNCDGSTNVLDLLILLDSWGPCPGCPADLNGDGEVSVQDLLALLEAWGG
jgi:hypothetical protein